MDLNWSLKEIYTSFNSKEFKDDIEKLEKTINEINNFAQTLDKVKADTCFLLEEYINYNIQLITLVRKLSSFVNLSLSINANDSNAAIYSDFIDNKLAEQIEAATKVEKWISKLDNLEDLSKKSELVNEHKFILKEIKDNSKYLLSEREEAIIAKMKTTGSTAWLKYKDKIIANHKIDFDGELITLTSLLNKYYDSSQVVRKKAYQLEIESYASIEDGIASALNAIKGEVLTVSKLRGYNSPLEMTLINSRLDNKTLNAMFDAIKESLPIFREYLKQKAKLLGHKSSLPYYDIFAPIGKSEMKFTYQEASDFVVKNFNTFSKHLGDYARKAIDNSWIDVMPKEGKVGGAFCDNLHYIGESRILLNFGGSFSDVVTLAHELGHGFHGECLNNQSILNSDYPMPIAETASTFCETIIKKAAITEVSNEEALAILETEISDACQVIVDIYSRFLFEDSLFEKRKEGPLSAKQINDIMIDAQKEAYGDGLDSDYLHPYMWTWKPHYYDVDYNYYNFPYAFGLLFAKGLYAEYQKRGNSFVKEYEDLLSITGKMNIVDIAKFMNIDIADKSFWINSIDIIKEDIDKFMDITNKR